MFLISEKGDLSTDNQSFCDHLIGDILESEYRIAKSRIISLKYKGFFENDFIKYYRNTKTDDEIKQIINEKIDNLFVEKTLRLKIEFVFKNVNNKFLISFIFKYNKNKTKSLISFDIKC